MIPDRVETSLNYIRDNAKKFAKAKAEVIFLKAQRKRLIAELKIVAEQENPKKYSSDAKQDRYARAHVEYGKLLFKLKSAAEVESEIFIMMKAAEYNIEVWRTLESTKRAEMKLT